MHGAAPVKKTRMARRSPVRLCRSVKGERHMDKEMVRSSLVATFRTITSVIFDSIQGKKKRGLISPPMQLAVQNFRSILTRLVRFFFFEKYEGVLTQEVELVASNYSQFCVYKSYPKPVYMRLNWLFPCIAIMCIAQIKFYMLDSKPTSYQL
jgi:hypothetical protein